MSTQAEQIGEARWAGGRVVAVYDTVRQAILQADVAIGATTLGPLDSAFAFNPAGGDVAVTLPDAPGPIVYTYDAIDYDAVTLHLVAGPVVTLVAGSTVRPDPALVDRLADVREGTQADPIACRIPYAMRPWIAPGTRAEGQGEEVLYGLTSGAGYVLHDVLGSVPLLPEGGSWLGDMPVGTIMAWPTTAVPARWLQCDGSLYQVADFPELAAVLFATFGGDGVVTFAVPQLMGRYPRGSSAPGGASDADQHVHTPSGIVALIEPAHQHGRGGLATDNPGPHEHGGGGYSTGTSGSHGHPADGGHGHGSTGNSTAGGGNQAGTDNQRSSQPHSHSTSSVGDHSHGSAGGHSHGTIAGNSGSAGGHTHAISGTVADGGSHGHTMAGQTDAAASQVPHLDVLWIIKAVPGGDPLATGAHVEVRDEGVPEVPAATVLDFRGPGVQVDPSGTVAVVTVGAQSGVTDHGGLTGLVPDDDHTQYHTDARGDARYSRTTHAHAGAYEPAGTVAAHEAAADPHAGYTTPTEASALDAQAIADHEAEADPHVDYTTSAELGTAVSDHVANTPHAGHPDLPTHDALGLATDAELSTHQAAPAAHGTQLDDLGDVTITSPAAGQLLGRTAGGWANVAPGAASHPDLATHDGLGLATDAELAAHAATSHGTAHPNLAAHDSLGLATDAELTSGLAGKAATSHTHTVAQVPQAFPVGSIFFAAVATDPSALLGYGTWARFGQGRVVISQDGSDGRFSTNGQVGGAWQHTHAQHAGAGGHTHDSHTGGAAGSGGANKFNGPTFHSNPGDHTHDAHQFADAIPPYIVVYVWQRTA